MYRWNRLPRTDDMRLMMVELQAPQVSSLTYTWCCGHRKFVSFVKPSSFTEVFSFHSSALWESLLSFCFLQLLDVTFGFPDKSTLNLWNTPMHLSSARIKSVCPKNRTPSFSHSLNDVNVQNNWQSFQARSKMTPEVLNLKKRILSSYSPAVESLFVDLTIVFEWISNTDTLICSILLEAVSRDGKKYSKMESFQASFSPVRRWIVVRLTFPLLLILVACDFFFLETLHTMFQLAKGDGTFNTQPTSPRINRFRTRTTVVKFVLIFVSVGHHVPSENLVDESAPINFYFPVWFNLSVMWISNTWAFVKNPWKDVVIKEEQRTFGALYRSAVSRRSLSANFYLSFAERTLSQPNGTVLSSKLFLCWSVATGCDLRIIFVRGGGLGRDLPHPWIMSIDGVAHGAGADQRLFQAAMHRNVNCLLDLECRRCELTTDDHTLQVLHWKILNQVNHRFTVLIMDLARSTNETLSQKSQEKKEWCPLQMSLRSWVF